MACSCNKGQSNYEVRKPDGTTQKGLSQLEAAAMARRVGGTYRLTPGS